jgi:hypothetical protein
MPSCIFYPERNTHSGLQTLRSSAAKYQYSKR